jgi:soluble lytic murein transglycosylase-like protein
MAPLKLSVAVVALLLASPARADPVAQWQPHVAEASARFGVPADLIERVIRAESGGRTMLGGRPITSHAGAMGLMQLMPGTWTEVRARLRLGADPHNPRDNILAGTAYLRMMYDRFGHPGMFAAYNAGPGRYATYLAGRSRLPGETVAYVQKITGESYAPVLKRPVGRLTADKAPEPISKRPSGSGPNSDSIFFIRRPAL